MFAYLVRVADEARFRWRGQKTGSKYPPENTLPEKLFPKPLSQPILALVGRLIAGYRARCEQPGRWPFSVCQSAVCALGEASHNQPIRGNCLSLAYFTERCTPELAGMEFCRKSAVYQRPMPEAGCSWAQEILLGVPCVSVKIIYNTRRF